MNDLSTILPVFMLLRSAGYRTLLIQHIISLHYRGHKVVGLQMSLCWEWPGSRKPLAGVGIMRYRTPFAPWPDVPLEKALSGYSLSNIE